MVLVEHPHGMPRNQKYLEIVNKKSGGQILPMGNVATTHFKQNYLGYPLSTFREVLYIQIPFGQLSSDF